MSPTSKGILCIILSAVLFGLMPVFVRLACEEGSNGLNVNFLRALITLPITYAMLRTRGMPIAFPAGQWKSLLPTFGVGVAVTTTLLFLSYAYIPVGVATSLHFVYPAAVTLAYVVFFKARLQKATWAALAACMTGVLILGAGAAGSGASLMGAALAFASGLTYAVYFIGLDKTELKYVSSHRLIFALSLINVLCTGVMGLAAGGITFDLSLGAWGHTALLAVTATSGAAVLLRGIQLTDGATAAILSTLEPITSFMFAAAILGEAVAVPQIISCAFILSSVLILTRSKVRKK